jgi:chromosome segregation protein
MIQFERMRLVGFKSFVDPTELVIEPGLTGVVGPNGCGKSNLVEALKWVMGETSAKQMRGSDMDDVIFGGTSERPARNIAEVTLVLNNASRTAPAQFNDQDELEISRRIERNHGSGYKVNGREVRARDASLVFADAATGARSTALVSQGRIGAIINAKPADRRSLLEEAAGIAGLHSRRHEAEIRLRGAEANLARLEDVLVTLEAQLQSLGKQAKQASRYRGLSDMIRAAEARLLMRRWGEAIEAIDSAKLALEEIGKDVVLRTEAAAVAATVQAEAAADLPELRQSEAEAAARLQRLLVAGEQLDAEEKRIAEAARDVAMRLEQISADLGRESALVADALQALERLALEKGELEAKGDGEEAAHMQAREALSRAAQLVNESEQELSRLTEKVAAEEARRNALLRRQGEIEDRKRRLDARAEELKSGIATAEAEIAADLEVKAAAERMEQARLGIEQARASFDQAEQLRLQTDGERAKARDLMQQEEAKLARLKAEAEGLAALLASGRKEGTPILDSVEADSGYEKALGAALGEDLEAPADPSKALYWTALPPYDAEQPLPAGAEPLSRHVRGPAELTRRLAQTGLAENGEDLRAQLLPGQRLVSRAGDLWRWDGFTIKAGAPTAAATRLEQRNRLAEVNEAAARAEAEAGQAREASEQASAAAQSAQDAARLARDAQRAAEQELARATAEHNRLMERAQAAQNKLAGLSAGFEQAGRDIAEAEQQLADAKQQFEASPDPAEGRAVIARLREKLGEERSALLEARAAHDRLMRESGERKRRLELVTGEMQSWTARQEASARQQEELRAREAAAQAEAQRLSSLPAEIEAKRQSLLTETGTASQARREAADLLAKAEARLAEADRVLKSVEHALAQAREERVRREAAVESGKQLCRTVAERIAERLECTPEQIAETVGIPEDETLPAAEDLEKKLERLLRERDQMGPVNLRAEVEAEELTNQLTSLKTEREDLVAAIARLRQGIAELNREGRERLLASFEAVDKHFRELFVNLFGGGRAHLTLTESDDPLESGLEIMASPPGKRLQVMSLLSGGEQALTALALLFAVFLTNPAPICVLDEVDAPLDDANVDRFCTLLSSMADAGTTRFLVVTHHRMTMARMDRLFGVTMAERGVSRLVSVDLRTAETLRATA